MKEKIFLILFLLIISIPAVYALLQPGFFLSDDGEWMVIRFSAFYQALVDGQFPVRFLGRLNFGYGYPVANFLYPGFMYLATPLQILGIGFVNSIKIILIASMLGGGIFSFLWLRRIFDSTSAFVGGVVFTYAPYHLFDLYKRGSVGELLSLMFVPFILWAIEGKNKALVSIGVFFLAISHNSLFLLFVPLLFVYSIIRKCFSYKDTLVTFVLGALMSSFFTIPAIIELSYTNFSNIKISEISEYFATFDLIGSLSLIILLSSFYLIFSKKIQKRREAYFFILISIFSILFSLRISEFIWNILPSNLIQFPFRLLSLLVISSAFLSAAIVSSNQRFKISLVTFFIILSFFNSIKFLSPKVFFDKGDSFYSTNEATTTVKDEYMPKWVEEKPNSRFDSKVELSDKAEISNLFYNSKRIYFETLNRDKTLARINTIYYPGWEAKINGSKSNISFDNPKGVMEINLPKGDNKVEFVFGETPLRLVADLISAVSLIILLVWTRKELFGFFQIRKYL